MSTLQASNCVGATQGFKGLHPTTSLYGSQVAKIPQLMAGVPTWVLEHSQVVVVVVVELVDVIVVVLVVVV